MTLMGGYIYTRRTRRELYWYRRVILDPLGAMVWICR